MRRAGPRAPRAAAAAAVLLALAPGAAAQTLEEIRDDLRQALGAARYPAFIAGLLGLVEENELSAAKYHIDDGLGTTVSTIKLPFRTAFPLVDAGHGVFLEGNLGVLGSQTVFEDFWGGEAPEIATSIDADWRAYSGLLGVGAELRVTEGLTLTPLFDLSLAYVRSEATYGGPGADLTALILDGVFLNWSAWILTWGPALRLDWRRTLDDEVAVELLARYDLRRSDTLTSTDPAQDGIATTQRVTFRADLTGPTSMTVGEQHVRWRTTLGYTRFLGDTADVLGFEGYAEVGGAFEIPLPDAAPLVSGLTLSGALLVGSSVRGYTIGVGGSF